MALLHTEKADKTALLKTARQTQQRLSQQLQLVLAQSGKNQMALAEIEPRIAIAAAAQASHELNDMIQSIDAVTTAVLNGGEQMLQDYNPIGLTKDLVQSNQRQQAPLPASDAAFEAFLAAGA